VPIRVPSFLVGLFCGGFIVASLWAVSVWWQPQRSPEDSVVYDTCLATQNGNTVACDAYMRVYKRAKENDDALEKKLKEGGAKMLAAGRSKRDVVEWASGMGGVGRQLSDAAGISLKELQDGKY
jgi:hypothetical protein